MKWLFSMNRATAWPSSTYRHVNRCRGIQSLVAALALQRMRLQLGIVPLAAYLWIVGAKTLDLHQSVVGEKHGRAIAAGLRADSDLEELNLSG